MQKWSKIKTKTNKHFRKGSKLSPALTK